MACGQSTKIGQRRRGPGGADPWDRLSDAELLLRFAEGRDGPEGLAFATLVRRYGWLVLSVCRRWTGNLHDAEDAFQVTFLILANRAGSIRRPDRLGPWLHGVAVRTARRARDLAHRRRRSEVQEGAMTGRELAVDQGRHDAELVRREEADVLHEEIAGLPERYRLPILLCDLGGLTHAEAASRLRWPVGSLSVRLVRARTLLRERLARRGLAPTLALFTEAAAAARSEAAPPLVPLELHAATVRLAVRFAQGPASGLTGASSSVAALAGDVMGRLALGLLTFTTATAGVIGMVALFILLLVQDAGMDRRREIRPAETRSGKQAAATAVAGSAARPTDHAANGARDGGRDARTPADRAADERSGTVVAAASEPAVGEILKTYRARAFRTGRDAGSQVGLALWCEERGLTHEGLKHLALAVLMEPSHPAARGLLGQVAHAGRWRRPDDLAALIRDDTRLAASLAEYDVRRDRLEPTADDHWRLALWCEQHGLSAEARAHLTAVTRLDPAKDAAWRRLGYQESRGRWRSPAQIDEQRRAAEAQKQADHLWRPLFEKWRRALQEGPRRDEAEANLSRVSDPLAVPAIWAVFAAGGPESQAVAVRLLGQVDGPAASRALALLAVFARTAELRRVATETLARRDPRDCIDLLVSLLEDPIRYEVRPVQGPGAPGILFVEGEHFNLRRFYTVPPLPDDTIRRLIDPTTPPDSMRTIALVLGEGMARFASLPNSARVFRNNVNGVRGNLALAAVATTKAQQQQWVDVAPIEAHNRVVAWANQRVEAPLRAVTGQDFGPHREVWRAWWTDQQGYAYEPPPSGSAAKPTIDSIAPPAFVPQYRRITGSSCFGAGTPVRTREGLRPIEAIRIGDVVLTQDTTTGSLHVAPVLAVFHNRPAATVRLRLDGEDEPIVVTGIHRFWKTGRGWAMARDLAPGDSIRTLGGRARVVSVSEGQVEPVFNLEVGPEQTFFAGRSGVLVHDQSRVQPVPRPFDQVPPSPGDETASSPMVVE